MARSRLTAWPTKPSTSTGVVSANGGSRRDTASECGSCADVSPHQHLARNDYGLVRSLCGSDGLSRASGLPDGGRRAVERLSGRGVVAGEVFRTLPHGTISLGIGFKSTPVSQLNSNSYSDN